MMLELRRQPPAIKMRANVLKPVEVRRQLPATKVRANLSKPVETGWNVDFYSSPLNWT
jgi:hypothetical protein